MPRLHVLRVFTGPDGEAGNPLGVFLDGGAVPPEVRQRMATRLGFSETVYIDDPATGRLEIYTPAAALPFAGHPLVGAAWLLGREAATPPALHPPAGEVAVRVEDGRTWIRAQPQWSPPFELWRYNDVAVLEGLGGPPVPQRLVYAWAWLDEDAGEVRSRAFAPQLGVPEDEATGSAAIVLTASLRRALTIRQGRGSELRTVPRDDGSIEVGGAVVLDEVREEPLG